MEDLIYFYWLEIAQQVPTNEQLARMRKALATGFLEGNNSAKSQRNNDSGGNQEASTLVNSHSS